MKQFIQKWIDKILNSPFIKNVLTLSAGIVLSQAIALFTTPVISRIYDPQILGDFSIMTANSTIISTVICMGLIPAIMLPSDDDEAKGICQLLAKLILGCATLLLLAGWLLADYWQMFSVSIDYRAACLMLWLIVVVDNLSNVCYSYINRQKLYKVLFWNPSLGTVSNAVINIVMGLMGFGLWGYLWSHIISRSLIILHMLRHANPFRKTTGCKSVQLLKKYKDFPLVLMPSNLIGNTSAQLPVLLLSRYWGSFVLGSYSMCMTILKLPAKFLAGPVNQVFYREATERIKRNENIGEFAFSLIKSNVKIALIPFLLLTIFGRFLFAFILGEEWSQAGDFASIMSFYVLLDFCTSCISGKFVLIGKKKTILIINIFVLLTNAAVFFGSHLLGLSAVYTIIIFSVVGGLMSLVDLLIFMKCTNVSVLRFAGFILVYLILPIAVATMLRILIFGI